MTVRTALTGETMNWTDEQIAALFANSITAVTWLRDNLDNEDATCHMPEEAAISFSQLSLVAASVMLFHALEVLVEKHEDDEAP